MNRTKNNLTSNLIVNNFDLLKQYIIPSDTLTEMLKIYELLGKNELYIETLDTKGTSLKNLAFEKDVYFLVNFLRLDVSDTRLRLIITKGSEPRNKNERSVVGIKEVLQIIRKNAEEYSFNGSDILDYLNRIFGKGSHKFSSQNPSVSVRDKKMPISRRLSFEKMLEEYHECFKKNTFEHLHLAIVAFLEMSEINPFSDNNELASILTLYYMILRSNVQAFEYISFMEKLFNNYDEFLLERNKSVINYPTGYFQLSGMMRIIFRLITQAYDELKLIVRQVQYDNRAFKSDNIEQAIMQMPYSFSKEDVRALYPNVSESTINRVLTKLRDENIIKPLGTGRSARWIKLISEQDPRSIFGKNYESEN